MQLSPVFSRSCDRNSWSLFICLYAWQSIGAERAELLWSKVWKHHWKTQHCGTAEGAQVSCAITDHLHQWLNTSDVSEGLGRFPQNPLKRVNITSLGQLNRFFFTDMTSMAKSLPFSLQGYTSLHFLTHPATGQTLASHSFTERVNFICFSGQICLLYWQWSGDTRGNENT